MLQNDTFAFDMKAAKRYGFKKSKYSVQSYEKKMAYGLRFLIFFAAVRHYLYFFYI